VTASREITFTGTDTLRIAAGKLAEYWANADSLLFFQQLGIREIPAQGCPAACPDEEDES